MHHPTVHCSFALLAIISLPSILSSPAGAEGFPVKFDLPRTVTAVASDDPNLVTIELRLSSMMDDPTRSDKQSRVLHVGGHHRFVVCLMPLFERTDST